MGDDVLQLELRVLAMGRAGRIGNRCGALWVDRRVSNGGSRSGLGDRKSDCCAVLLDARFIGAIVLRFVPLVGASRMSVQNLTESTYDRPNWKSRVCTRDRFSGRDHGC